MQIADYIDADLLDKFEFHNYNHAIEIITQAFPEEWREVVECLRKLDITTDDLREAGGNETKYHLGKGAERWWPGRTRSRFLFP